MAKKLKKSSPSSKRKPVSTKRTARSSGRSKPTAKKTVKKRTPVRSTGKYKKTTRYTPKAKKSTKRVFKKPVKKAAKRSYKQDYNKNLEKILKSLVKDVKDLKAGKEPVPGKRREKVEAFPLEEDFISQKLPSSQKEALTMIAEMRREINQRNIKLGDLMEGPGKSYFND